MLCTRNRYAVSVRRHSAGVMSLVVVLQSLCVAVAGLLSWILCSFWLSQRTKSGTTPIAGPKPSLFVGNISEIVSFGEYRTPILFLNWSKIYGKVYQFWGFLNKRFIFVNDPAAIKALLVTKFAAGDYAKAEEFQINYRPIFGRGIFGVNGKEWTRHRKFASFLFQRNNMKAHVSVFEKHARRLIARLESLPRNSEVDMQDYFMRYTLDSFGEIGFGCQLNAIDQERNQFAEAFEEVQTRIQKREKYFMFRHFMPRDNILEKNLTWLNNYCSAIIKERIKEPLEVLRTRPDLLSQAIVAFRAGDKAAPATSNEELRDFVVNFMIAGRDTTAVLLSWCSLMLSKHPNEQQKLIDELELVGWDAALSFERSGELRAMKRALQETLRMYPPVPNDGYQAQRNTVLPDGSFVPKGTPVLYCAYALHRQPDLWPEPEQYNPDRFTTAPAPYTFVPFHGGPRVCLGQDMAYLEAKVMLSLLLQRFQLQESPGFEVDPKFSIILTSLNGVKLLLADRE